MIPNVVYAIATALHENFHEAKIYFNPIRQVGANSFLLTLLNYSIEGEQGEILKHHFDWDIGYVPKIVQTPPTGEYGSSDDRMIAGAEVIQELSEILNTLNVKGFYNIITKEDDYIENIATFDRSITVVEDIYHYFFSMEFRAKKVEKDELLRTWNIIIQYLKEINL